jgi:glucan phosphoethanolaminetransferase (alkaline phosphatase superfamily)
MRREELALRVVGDISLFVAGLGLWYNLTLLRTILPNYQQDPEIPYFLPAFVVMSMICVMCYGLLVVSGIQFLQGRVRLAKLFIGVLVFEVFYVFATGWLWLSPEIGTSVAAATGVANGGLMYQAFALFPVWAPLVVCWTIRRRKG